MREEHLKTQSTSKWSKEILGTTKWWRWPSIPQSLAIAVKIHLFSFTWHLFRHTWSHASRWARRRHWISISFSRLLSGRESEGWNSQKDWIIDPIRLEDSHARLATLKNVLCGRLPSKLLEPSWQIKPILQYYSRKDCQAEEILQGPLHRDIMMW